MKPRHWRRNVPLRSKRPVFAPRRDRSDEFTSFQAAPREGVRMASALGERAPVTVEKEEPARSEEYRRLVAAMDCIHCGRKGPGVCQAAHADFGKGGGIKSDDRTCYPACATSPSRLGCHDLIGAAGAFTKEQRRTFEVEYARRTRATIRERGLWPAGLEAWPGE